MADDVTGEGSRAERRREARVDRPPRPRMADVTARPAVPQRAVAEAEVALSQETLSAIIDGRVSKGDVLGIAEIAGVMAGKRTHELIPLGHPVALTDLVVQAVPDRAASALRIRAETAATSPTGVEMEALTAASIAALTAYDMVKELQRDVAIRSVRLVSTSGASGEWQRGATSGERRPPLRGARGAGRASRTAAAHGRDGRRPPARGRGV